MKLKSLFVSAESRWLPKKIILIMKLTTLMILLAILQCSAAVFGQKISLNESNVPLKKVLKVINDQTGYVFFYESKVIRNKNISINIKDASLDAALAACLKNLHLSYEIVNNTIFIKELPVTVQSSATANVQQVAIKVTGQVFDEKNITLPGVTVRLKDGPTVVIADKDGKFSIDVPNANAVLIFSFIGYATQELPVLQDRPMNVHMQLDQSKLNEVVVLGYGSVKQSDLTGSVSTISSARVTQVKGISNVAQTLQGQMAGVQVNQASGQPGEGMKIAIRGTNSINGGNDPLYVIDGQITQGINAQLNVDDIASIDVLKDASSTAIYGSRGANGVIMITTKKGTSKASGKPQVSYDGYYGVADLRHKLKLIDASEYAQLQNEVTTNDNASGLNNPAKPLPWTPDQIKGLGKGTDWQDLVYNTAPTQNHTISVGGNTENTRYYTSFGYFNQEGIITNSSYRRLSGRINLDQKLNKQLNFNINLALTKDQYKKNNYQNADYGGVPFQTFVMPPTEGVYNPNGTYTVFTGLNYGQTNPVGMAKEQYNPSSTLRILGTAALTYEVIPGLKLRSSVSIDNSDNHQDNYNPPSITFGQPAGNASQYYSNSNSFVNENTVTYTHNWGKHNLNALAGFTFQQNHSRYLNSGTASGFVSTVYVDNSLQSATTLANPSTGNSINALISYLGRLNYNYAGKYYATFTARRDGSSVFGSNNKYAFFPSGALAWTVSEEDFLKENPILSNLKLRASYGTSGNQAINPYQTLASVSSINTILNNSNTTGYYYSSVSNNNLKWETTKELDLGIDVGIIKNRVNITADYYNKKTSNLLLYVNLPSSTGFGTQLQNVGKASNKGYEFSINSRNIVGSDFTWSSTLTYTHNQNKLLSLGIGADGKPIPYQYIGTGGNWFPMIVGQPMNSFFGQQVTGVYQTDAEAKANGEPTKHAGDYKFQDYNHDGVVNDDDKHVLTTLQPKFTAGFNNTFTYKHWDLSVLITGSYGATLVNELRKYSLTLNGQWTPTQAAYDSRWQGPGTSNAGDKPSANSMQYTRDYANSLWEENGNYLKIKDVTLGYTFNAAQLSRIKILSINIYISAQNYFTITKYTGYDPEVSWASSTVNGWDRGNYPSTKSITAGVRVKF